MDASDESDASAAAPPNSGDSGDPLDPEAELYELTRAFRRHLQWQARAGVYAVSAGPTAKPADWPYPHDDSRAGDPMPAAREARPAPGGNAGVPAAPGRAPDAAPAPGSFSAALAQALDETPAHGKARSTPAADQAAAANAAPRSPALTLAEVRAELGDCRRCKLADGREHIVFGDGDPHAPLMFIGEAPGADEDRVGRPFVGRAGELLGRMIEAMGWTRDLVYIANVLKCRPPHNRDPEADEIAACQPFLAKQIAAVAPRIIVTLGRPATHLVLETDKAIGALRGTFRPYRGGGDIRVMPTYHPAYLLRNPNAKRQTWNDLKQVIAELTRLHIPSPRPPKT
jgi:DNA polymerase